MPPRRKKAAAVEDEEEENFLQYEEEQPNNISYSNNIAVPSSSLQQTTIEEKREVLNTEGIPKEDILKILIATDNHLGAHERDRVRRDDAFITFEEILKTAVEKEVDFLLLGGDLFHENKPSRETLHRTLELFRKYVCGDKPVPLKIMSDQKVNFKHNFGIVNYEDPNFNISLPVFAIHGNHDDPTGENGLSAMDLLSVTNLINYFGKSDSIDDIQVKPILISKGVTKLALYGLGHIRDERLYRTFQQKKVKFFRPSVDKDDWFNLFVVHQNRHQHHTRKNTISDAMLRGFLDLVIWGHEHEQKIQPTYSAEGGFDVMQPGSSVAMSLIPEEAETKKIALLEIYKDRYNVTPVQLQTVRPFIFDHLVLSSCPELDQDKHNSEMISKLISEKVEDMIEESKKKTPSKKVLEQYPSLKLPLIRLKVDYTGGYSTLNPQRFGQRFVDKVANPADLLLFGRSKKSSKPKTSTNTTTTSEETTMDLDEDEDTDDLKTSTKSASDITIEDIVSDVIKSSSDKLSILNEYNMQEAVFEFVEKEEIHAIETFLKKQLVITQKHIWSASKALLEANPSRTIDEETIDDLISEYADNVRKTVENERKEGKRIKIKGENDEEEEVSDGDMPSSKTEAAASSKSKKKSKKDEEEEAEMPVSEEEESSKKKKGSTRGRGRGRGRGKATTTTSKKTVKKSKFKNLSDSEEEAAEEPDVDFDNEEEEEKPSSSKKRGRKVKEEEQEEEEEVQSTRRRGTKIKEEEQEEEETAPKRRKTTRGASSRTVVLVDSDVDE